MLVIKLSGVLKKRVVLNTGKVETQQFLKMVKLRWFHHLQQLLAET
jgi:hypothetical protein